MRLSNGHLDFVLDENALHSTLPPKDAVPAATDPADPDVQTVDALLAMLAENQESEETPPVTVTQGITGGANGDWDDIMDSDMGW